MYQVAVSYPGVDLPGDRKRENYEAVPKPYGAEHTLHNVMQILEAGGVYLP